MSGMAPARAKRGAVRKRVLKGGVITYAARQTSVPCVVRDVSETGAHLIVDLAPHIPDQFLLIIEIDGTEVDCDVVWRKAKDVGVRYVAPPRQAARRRMQVIGDAQSSADAAAPSRRPAAAATPGRAVPQTFPILIAEDDPDDQAFLADAFRAVGFEDQIVFVGDGVELLRYLAGEAPHRDRPTPGLILLDLNMPRLDGRGALQQIKASPIFKRIPVVVFSTSNVERDIAATYDLGVASYIPKPSTEAELTEIARMLTSYWSMAVRLPTVAI